MKKRILAAAVAAAAVLSLAGCNGSNNSTSSTTSKPATSGTSSAATSSAATSGATSTATSDATSGTTSDTTSKTDYVAPELKDDGAQLTIMTWSSNSDTKNMVKLFCQEKGYDESKVVVAECGAEGEDAREGYKKRILETDEDSDLYVCDADWIANYTNDDSLSVGMEALGLSKADFPDAYSYTLSFGTNDAGVFKAPTFQATPGGFVYRSDLAEQYLGVKTPDEMQALISDWDKFQEAGKTVAEKSEGKCSLQATEGGLWQVFQSNRTQPWVVDGKLVMDNAEDFYDIAKGMLDDKTLANVPQWNDAWYAAIKDGTAMGDFVPTWGLANNGTSILNNFTGNAESADNMAICAGPTGWFWGGSYFGVSPKCDNKTLAKEFIEFYCKNADSIKKYAEQTGDFVNNKKVIKELSATRSHPLLNGQNHYAVLTQVLDKLDLEGKITKYDSVIKGKFNDSVNALLKGEVADKAAAIAKFKSEVGAAIGDITVE